MVRPRLWIAVAILVACLTVVPVAAVAAVVAVVALAVVAGAATGLWDARWNWRANEARHPLSGPSLR